LAFTLLEVGEAGDVAAFVKVDVVVEVSAESVASDGKVEATEVFVLAWWPSWTGDVGFCTPGVRYKQRMRPVPQSSQEPSALSR
jgi:hypothetical protein